MTDKFNTKITQALDKSLGDLNQETLDALAAARQKALDQPSANHIEAKSEKNIIAFPRARKKYYVPALAAALLLAVIIPNVSQYNATSSKPISVESYYEVDPEMLETADILLLLGELAEEENGG